MIFSLTITILQLICPLLHANFRTMFEAYVVAAKFRPMWLGSQPQLISSAEGSQTGGQVVDVVCLCEEDMECLKII